MYTILNINITDMKIEHHTQFSKLRLEGTYIRVKVKRNNSFVDMTFFKKNPDAIIRYSDSQLHDDPIKVDPECVKLSTKFHTPITHMSEKQAHDNLLANEKWPWNWIEWTD